MAQTQSPQEVASAWSRNLLGAKGKITAGINAVTESPTAKAAKAADKYASGCAEAASSGRFAQRCNAVSLQDWRDAAINKGLKNLQTGVTQGESKVAKFMEQYLPYISQVSDRIQRMESGGRANAMARIEANLDALDTFKKSRK